MPHENASPTELHKLAQDSLLLLQQAFTLPFVENVADLAKISSLFHFEFYAKLLALLEINEVAIGITAPLEKYLTKITKYIIYVDKLSRTEKNWTSYHQKKRQLRNLFSLH